MTTVENRFGIEFLQPVIEFLESSCTPEEIFSEETLKGWAIDYGYEPADLFDDETLLKWALANGLEESEASNG